MATTLNLGYLLGSSVTCRVTLVLGTYHPCLQVQGERTRLPKSVVMSK